MRKIAGVTHILIHEFECGKFASTRDETVFRSCDYLRTTPTGLLNVVGGGSGD